jgi:hypothetical protein
MIEMVGCKATSKRSGNLRGPILAGRFGGGSLTFEESLQLRGYSEGNWMDMMKGFASYFSGTQETGLCLASQNHQA